MLEIERRQRRGIIDIALIQTLPAKFSKEASPAQSPRRWQEHGAIAQSRYRIRAASIDLAAEECRLLDLLRQMGPRCETRPVLHSPATPLPPVESYADAPAPSLKKRT
jgi:hypothetical protein